jgi:hypothetical protein
VSESFAIKLVKHQERSGSPAPVRQGRPPGTGKLAPIQAFLVGEVEKKPEVHYVGPRREAHGGA